MRGDSNDPADHFPGYDGLELAVLRRYVSGQSDAAERRRVEAWAAEAAERRRYLAAMRELFEHGPAAAEVHETAAAWRQVAARMEPPSASSAGAPAYVAPWDGPAVRVDVRRRQPPRILAGAFAERGRWRALLTTAAALVLTLGGGTLLLRARLHTVASAPVVSMRQIATAKGQRAELQLGDGSRVVLGVASRLRFPSKFEASSSRELYLEGTAYFDVVHDATRPFLVHTANAVTEDIGTRFVVTAYPESHSTQVVVADGAVALGAARASHAARVVLTRGHLGRLASADSAPSVRAVDPTPYSAWMRGELVFRDAPLSDVVAELQRWYDVGVQLGDPSLRDVPLTASFTAESFHEALAVVTTVLPLRAVRHGATVTLYRR